MLGYQVTKLFFFNFKLQGTQMLKIDYTCIHPKEWHSCECCSFVQLWEKSDMICSMVNKVGSRTKYQHFSPCLAFESLAVTAPAYQIAEELLSITGFCLLKSSAGDQFWPFSSDKSKKWKKEKNLTGVPFRCWRWGKEAKSNAASTYPDIRHFLSSSFYF